MSYCTNDDYVYNEPDIQYVYKSNNNSNQISNYNSNQISNYDSNQKSNCNSNQKSTCNSNQKSNHKYSECLRDIICRLRARRRFYERSCNRWNSYYGPGPHCCNNGYYGNDGYYGNYDGGYNGGYVRYRGGINFKN